MPKRQRKGFPGSPKSDSSVSSSGSSRNSFTQQRQGASSSNSDEVVQKLCGIFSDMRVEVARYLLEACNWDLERAVQLHLESPTEIPGSASSSEIPEHANRFNSLVINDDSDDDSEIPFVRQRRMSPVRQVERTDPSNPDEVRAPIAPQQMRLVDDMMDRGVVRPMPGQFRPLQYARAIGQSGASSSNGNNNQSGTGFRPPTHAFARAFANDDHPGASTFSRFRYMASDTLSPERLGDNNEGPSGSSEPSRSRSHQQPPAVLPNGAPVPGGEEASANTLDRIFRPPVDLLFRGTFQEARRFATSSNRWILVNIQELNEFPSLCLNRDVWRDAKFVELIENNFVLWQVYCDGPEGSRFVQFYKVGSYPFVGIVDPRTGERVQILPSLPDELFQRLNDFLAERPVPEQSPADSPLKKPKVVEEPSRMATSSSSISTATNGLGTAVLPVDSSKQASNTSLKIEPSPAPKQIDVSVCPNGSTAHFQVLVHLPNDDRVLVKLYQAASLQELVAAISSAFQPMATSLSSFTLIRNAATPGGAKSDLLSVQHAENTKLSDDTLGFCKREKLFLDLKQ